MNEQEHLLFPSISRKLISGRIEREVVLFAKKAKQLNLLYAPFEDIVGTLTGFELITTERNCGGYYDSANKQIAMGKPFKEDLHTLTHEMSHYLQDCLNIPYEVKTLSGCLIYEQQCETIAALLTNKIYGLQSNDFTTYFTKSSHLFLLNWYGNHIQNDMNLKQ